MTPAAPSPTRDPSAPRSPDPRFLKRWVAYVTLGETLGFLVPASVGVLTATAEPPPTTLYLVAIVAGFGEGAVLGVAQALALRRSGVGIRPLAWTVATGAGASVAYALGWLPFTLLRPDWSAPSTWALVAVGALVLLASIPLAQWWFLRGHVPGAWRWIPLNALAWSLGLLWTFAPSPLIDETTATGHLILVYAIAGLLMAVTVALVTGLGLRRMLNRSAGRSAPTAA